MTQVFSSVHDRTNAALICFSAIFRQDDYKFTLQNMLARDHPPFLSETINGSPTTITKRRLCYLLDECVVFQELLLKASKLGSLVSKKCSMAREKLWWLIRQVTKISSVELDIDGDEVDVEHDTEILIDLHRVKTKPKKSL